MRIAIVSLSANLMGGVEEYLARVMPLLQKKGHELALLHETALLPDLALIPVPSGVPVWNMATLGQDAALRAVREWKCDVLYANGVAGTVLANALVPLAPSVFSVHVFWGTCVSSTKSFRSPVETPCDRAFGPACLANFYPRRCGGLNPLSLVRDYGLQAQRLAVLKRYNAVVTHSEYMRREYEKHGIRAECVYLPLEPASPPAQRPAWSAGAPRRLLFLGRMTALKGTHLLLDALGPAQIALGVGLHLTLAGDGPERGALEAQAKKLFANRPDVVCDFIGWADPSTRTKLLQASDLLVVPSNWPEPFGMVGPEAAAEGLPAVAFAVGGIPEWLRDGVNGLLAPGDPPKVEGLTKVIVESLASEERHKALCAGARATYGELARADAAAELTAIFERVRTR